MANPLEEPLYYLHNFRQVLHWLGQRYADLLDPDEEHFIQQFDRLPQASQALLVRMVMRKGVHFRAGKLNYVEIGCTQAAAGPLLELGWVDDECLLAFDALFALLQKGEILAAFKPWIEQPKAKKTDWLEGLSAHFTDNRCFAHWCPDLADTLYSLTVMDLCDRLRLMFFGNLHQDWSEFVLADLGIYTYEKVEFCAESRGLRSRDDVQGFLFLHQCQQAFETGAALEEVLAQVATLNTDNPWLEKRRAKLLFQVGQYCERTAELALAEQIYRACAYPGARSRLIRVLERQEHYVQAMALANAAQQAPESAAEQQHLLRVVPRLRRKLGEPALPKVKPRPVTRLDLALALPDPLMSVEYCVQAHLSEPDGPVHYVENGLINSLFGLLCWDVIFAPLPGSFFHPFQRGPADLHSEDFHLRRAPLFAACFEQLQDERYKTTIRQRYSEKWGIQSPFVFWNLLSAELLEQALACLPAEHLRYWFERLLLDIRANRAGMPDLIQFWPAQKTYRMIEVKGPGDRLQDNQLRWLEFCGEYQMPVTVCYVRWAASA
ncbi:MULTISPECIES: VRR-NUC domain-containing protein [Pseudomonas fluorescens group]|uniref:phosphodiesterase I n=2 Tax=Pseudomonas fluorescens TaxID=294 RepID=C3KBE7_PSEFS|nr:MULTISPECIES: VRR-NUC domain-containing protein [Pseudomonas fluorescens group]KJZ52997.1 nuclease [Pseudomonas marginalis]KJZ54227.1 nuclease [Pseudomonas marginalis]MBZ6454170.1 VRR-NUC domain-containing protein [Pseudomonas fluorescens group sp.]MBZ6460156.1 VRR-NUC domain-containing protein [Pseudomonas fluorescens group sp.]MBZ6465797.1 VRR-NUC domain-containing protein [Pseudomonas fluorescens group sp.]